MAKWARLEGNYVAEVTDINPIGRYHSSLIWEQVPGYVDQHYTFVEDEDGNKVWNAPVADVIQLTPEEIAAIIALAQSQSTEETPAP